MNCVGLKVVASVLLACTLTGCGKKEPVEQEPGIDESKIEIQTSEDRKGESPAETPLAAWKDGQGQNPEGMVISYLTGEYVPEAIGRRRPVAVMLNNIKNAVPQAGIANAGVVYEALVEGKITRLMGIFEDYDDLEKIGSVRSCRDYYVFYAQEFDAFYAHYGQAVYAVPFLAQEFVNNLSGLSAEGDTVYYRTSDRPSPHNAYTSFDGIQKGIRMLDYSQDYDPDYGGHYVFARVGEEVSPDGGTEANEVRLNCFGSNKPWFAYDSAEKVYHRFQYGDAQIDELTDQQLQCKNIILQYSSCVPYDQNGYLNIDTQTGGEGKFITEGKAIDITWEKESPWGVTHYYDADHREITLNTGKTWVEIVLSDSTDQIEIE